MSASEDGKVRLYDLREGEETLAVESSGMFCYRFVGGFMFYFQN